MNEMNRLFISTKEHYMPLQKIIGAYYLLKDPKEKGKVYLLNSSNEPIGYIPGSSDEEAKWFLDAIFKNQRNDKNLIINYKTKTITEVSQIIII